MLKSENSDNYVNYKFWDLFNKDGFFLKKICKNSTHAHTHTHTHTLKNIYTYIHKYKYTDYIPTTSHHQGSYYFKFTKSYHFL